MTGREKINPLWLKQIMNDICIECIRKGNPCLPETCSILPNKVASTINKEEKKTQTAEKWGRNLEKQSLDER